MNKLVKLIAMAGVLLLSACAEQPQGPIEKIQVVFPAPPDEPRFYFERSFYGSGQLQAGGGEEESALKRALVGTDIGETLSKPYAVAVYQGKVFVSDSVAREVKVFDLPNRKYYSVGGDPDDGKLAMPLGLEVDGQGNLYVVDATPKNVKVYDKDGKFLRTLAGPKLLSRPAGITVDKAGERVYVVDIGGVSSESHTIKVLDAKSGEHLLDIGKRGYGGEGELNLPRDAVIGPDNLLYVVDSGNFRVEVFTLDGKFVRAFGKVGLQLGNFSRPKEIAADKDGNLYIIDAAFGNFQIFTPTGELLMFVGGRSEQDRPAKYGLPSGIAVDEDGRVFVADQLFRKLEIFRPATLKPEQGVTVLGKAAPATPASGAPAPAATSAPAANK